MDVERSLLSRAIKSQAIEVPISRGVLGEHFVGRRIELAPGIYEPASSEVWDWIVGHYRRFRAVPSFELATQRFPTYRFIDVSDPLDAVLEQFMAIVKRRRLIDTIRVLSDVADDPVRVIDAELHLQEEANQFTRLVPTSAVHRFSDMPSRIELYKKREAAGGQAPGVSLMVEEFDDFTYGIQPGEMALIEGFLGRGKSTMTIGMAARAYFFRDETPLFMSLEMDADKMFRRWDAYAAAISAHALKRLQLGDDDKEKWERAGEKAADSRLDKDILVIDDLWHPPPERVYAEIERWRPDWTVVDTIDEISAPSEYKTLYERQSYAARELKGIARTTKKPLVAVVQAGRDAEQEGAKLGNIAGAIDIARKADIAIGLHADAQMKAMWKMRLELLKNRDDAGEGTKVDYYWGVPNLEFRRWQPGDAMPVREAVPV